jgi:hypothetical protein
MGVCVWIVRKVSVVPESEFKTKYKALSCKNRHMALTQKCTYHFAYALSKFIQPQDKDFSLNLVLKYVTSSHIQVQNAKWDGDHTKPNNSELEQAESNRHLHRQVIICRSEHNMTKINNLLLSDFVHHLIF